MSVREQRYIIRPESACPQALMTRPGIAPYRVTLDMADVAQSGWGEILQTAPRGNSLFAFFEDLLEPGPDLIWKENGPGRGTEMRRSFSGLFGRIFARSYLEAHHDFIWFCPIDGDFFHLSPTWRVRRRPGLHTDLPDWICAGPGHVAIGEAKGSHQKGGVPLSGTPQPIRTAEQQILGIQVDHKVGPGSISGWQSRSLKGWAVMSRWGTVTSGREPYLFALDPKTIGEPMSADETEELVQLIARRHVEQIGIGLGILKPSPERGADATAIPGAFRRVPGTDVNLPGSFRGAVVSPFGPLAIGLDQARAVADQLPDRGLMKFVGLEEEVIAAYLDHKPLKALVRARGAEGAIRNGDGLLVAPVGPLTDKAEPDAG